MEVETPLLTADEANLYDRQIRLWGVGIDFLFKILVLGDVLVYYSYFRGSRKIRKS